MAEFTANDYHAARAWAEEVLTHYSKTAGKDSLKAAEIIMSLEVPKTSMEDVEWDDEQHFLAEAEYLGNKVIMLARETDNEDEPNGWICILSQNGSTGICGAEYLYPTGRKATLKRPDQPAREEPEEETLDYLGSEWDYSYAPVGTRAEYTQVPGAYWEKVKEGWKPSLYDNGVRPPDSAMAGDKRKVIRWGNEN